MGISSGALFFVIAVFYIVDAADYDVKLLLTSRFDGIEELEVFCGTQLVDAINVWSLRESTHRSSFEVRCTGVNDVGGVRLKLGPSAERSLPDQAGGWRGYWKGVIIDISEEVVGLSQGSDCLGSYFDVRKLEESGFAYDVAIVDSYQAYGKFESYFNTDHGAPVFAYEQELRDGNGNDIEDNRINCFQSRHTKCCSVVQPSNSLFLVSMHIYDVYNYSGMIICVGDSLGSCKYGVYKGGVTYLTKFWRSFNISIPKEVLNTESEEKITFERNLFITIYGSVIGPDSDTERISFKYETVGSIQYNIGYEYLVDTHTFISDQKIILSSIRKISAPRQSHFRNDKKWIKLEVSGVPQRGKYFTIELFYLDGYRPRRKIYYSNNGSSLPIPMRNFGDPYNVVRIYFRIDDESYVNYFDLEDNENIPEVHMSNKSLYEGFEFNGRHDIPYDEY